MDDGETIVVSPHKVDGPHTKDLTLQRRKRAISKVGLAGMSASLGVDAHLRQLTEDGFEVHVVKDATAAAQHPKPGDGYQAALINLRLDRQRSRWIPATQSQRSPLRRDANLGPRSSAGCGRSRARRASSAQSQSGTPPTPDRGRKLLNRDVGQQTRRSRPWTYERPINPSSDILRVPSWPLPKPRDGSSPGRCCPRS